MTETEKKALALLNECAGQEVHGGWKTFDPNLTPYTRALIRAIEQHEAFRQEVSDAVEAHYAEAYIEPTGRLTRFIIAKPDPLVEAAQEVAENAARKMGIELTARAVEAEWAEDLRAALTKRGLKIVEIDNG